MDEKIKEIEEWQNGETFLYGLTYSICIEEYWKARKYAGILLSHVKELEEKLKQRESILCPECLQTLEPDGSCLTCRFAKRVKELEDYVCRLIEEGIAFYTEKSKSEIRLRELKTENEALWDRIYSYQNRLYDN